jgi:hypothetical protein
MATLHPSLAAHKLFGAGGYRERDVLALLEQGLTDGFDVFHTVDWSTMHNGGQTFGELDAVVLSPNGHLVLLEVKAGDVTVSDDGLTKLYPHSGGQTKDIGHQSRRQHGAIRDRLNKQGLKTVKVAHLLVLPDQKVSAGTVAYPRDRVVDATQMDEFCSLVRAALPAGQVPGDVRVQVMEFLANRFHVLPDPSTHIGQAQRASAVLAEGLATWVPRISHAGGVFVVEATAGSGKTQLALALLVEAARTHKRAAYVCFNRPLADHINAVAPSAVEVSNFHEYAVNFARKQGREPDFSAPGVFDLVAQDLIDHAQDQPGRLDLLVVDESQDFDATWVEALSDRLKSDGRLYVLGDENQRIYDRDEFALQDAVRIRCMDNFRSPCKVVSAINQLRLASEPVQARAPAQGQAPGFHTYVPGGAGSLTVLEKCLKRLMKDGFSADQISVITFAGRERSEVLARDKLAGLTVNRFTGGYDAAGNTVWTGGELLVETLYRFKGQSAPVVVLCEVDFDALSDKELRKLFVGFTRAQFRLECVLSDRAATALMARAEE